MELRQIKYFLAICDERSFTRAARRCRVAQPSLTESIKKLEGELGAVLFHRGHMSTEATEFGQSLRPRFQAVAKAIEEAHELAASFAMRNANPLEREVSELGRLNEEHRHCLL